MKRIVFSDQAKADIRRIDQPTAIRILESLHRFAETGKGDVKQLKRSADELRLRVGDYRLRFTEPASDTLQIKRVLHRSEAYR